jgi:hypothetical protein
MRAGKMPKKIPIAEDTTIATITATALILAGKKNLVINTTIVANISPDIPPKRDSAIDSERNCIKISFSVAPIARLIPISFVLFNC